MLFGEICSLSVTFPIVGSFEKLASIFRLWEELMQLNGRYAHLFTLQARGYR